MENFKYKLSLATTKVGLQIKISNLDRAIKQKQRIMGPAVFDLLMANEHRAAEDVFVDCKKSVDANKHALEKAVRCVHATTTRKKGLQLSVFGQALNF